RFVFVLRADFLRFVRKGGQLLMMASTGSSLEPALRGRLEQFGLATVLTFLDLERRSGELVVVGDEASNPNNRVGRLWLRHGRVLRARIEGSRRLNKSAVYDLLSLERGRFSFAQMDLDGLADELGVPTMQLLMEAARRVDEAAASATP
ncbi:MAG TPA: DUF4388 domain-containing protein, partial [Polyangia bacterium]|nr:DUF4388 domain-containing protein [Polyangia bacterium]